MNSDPFDKLADEIESDPLGVLEARWRRSIAISALKGRPDVLDVIPSGSLARGTHLGPIHDVDLIVVFEESMHSDWRGSGSAQAALEHLQTAVRETMQAGAARPLGLIHDAELRNHVVKSSLDPSLGRPGAILPDTPPVDLMPAVREGSHLRVPERFTDSWIDLDPEPLMGMVAARERAWSNFDEVVRMIKDWAGHQGLMMKGPAAEVLVLKYLPQPGLFEIMSCSDAVVRFFEAASRARISRLADPVGRRGEIDPSLSYARLREALDRSAEFARRAVEAERAWRNRGWGHEGVTHPSVFWQHIFGKDRFKRPRVWYWSLGLPAERPALEERYWFDQGAEPADESAWSWRPSGDSSGPDSLDRTTEPRGAHPGVPAESAEPMPHGPSLDQILSSITQDVPATPSIFGDGSGPEGPPGSGPGSRDRGLYDPGRRRYLKGQCPESIPVDEPFSLVVSVVLVAGASTAELEHFGVPAEGRDVLLVIHAPGLRLLGKQRQLVHVPADKDSRPVMFELCAGEPGAQSVSITAWLSGSYLGELRIDITAERGRPPGPHQEVHARITTESTEGAVSLVVRYDRTQKAYRFEFRDEDYPEEVTSHLAYDPKPLVEQLVARLDNLVKGRGGYSASQARDFLENAGADLWHELVPEPLREQFWDRQRRIRQLTILADKDGIPWELLYPKDPGHDAGFLVE